MWQEWGGHQLIGHIWVTQGGSSGEQEQHAGTRTCAPCARSSASGVKRGPTRSMPVPARVGKIVQSGDGAESVGVMVLGRGAEV